NLVLGYLDADAFLAGRMKLSRTAAEAAIDRLATDLGLSRLETAHGVFRVANANMLRAIRVVSVERGLDPRLFALLAFGGAGPVHATALANELDMPQVIIPANPGNFSALGLLVADLSRDAVQTQLTPLAAEARDSIQSAYDRLAAQLVAEFVAEGYDATGLTLHRSADARYVGQAYEVNVTVPDGQLSAEDLAAPADSFHAAHAERYGHNAPGERVELVNFRLTVSVPTPKPTFRRDDGAGDGAHPRADTRRRGDGATDGERGSQETPGAIGVRDAWFEATGDPMPTPVYDRVQFSAGVTLVGPAIVEEPGSTTVLQPGQSAVVDGIGNLIIQIRAGAS
ncbi:MAG: hydantoinase/oxoprolinase family protein, partial [Chloroflexi bacterium]|nr:hydantoinase/oxoprolinase family protein [Chloroflexota bacterium]